MSIYIFELDFFIFARDKLDEQGRERIFNLKGNFSYPLVYYNKNHGNYKEQTQNIQIEF